MRCPRNITGCTDRHRRDVPRAARSHQFAPFPESAGHLRHSREASASHSRRARDDSFLRSDETLSSHPLVFGQFRRNDEIAKGVRASPGDRRLPASRGSDPAAREHRPVETPGACIFESALRHPVLHPGADRRTRHRCRARRNSPYPCVACHGGMNRLVTPRSPSFDDTSW